MPRILLRIIASTEGHTVLKKPPGDISPYQGRGSGDIDLLCGTCHHMLAEHVYPDWVAGIVLCCPICGAFNETAALEPDRPRATDTSWQTVQARDLRRR
ncbi:MAG TPA: hypothetical protein VK701_05280 [Solirubrobacteraceae bacterium]|jgi:hypothetical protein|nr:hypothetical protein [Solirubrobacteraceae bacterium]